MGEHACDSCRASCSSVGRGQRGNVIRVGAFGHSMMPIKVPKQELRTAKSDPFGDRLWLHFL